MSTEPATGQSQIRRSLLIGISAVAMLVYALAAVFTDTRRLDDALIQLGWGGMSMILLLSLVNYVARFWRWNLYITQLAHRLPTVQHCLYYLSGFTYTISPGKVGEAMRSVYLRQHGVTLSMSFAAMFAERLLDLGVVLLLATLMALANASYVPLVIGVAVALGTLGGLVASGHLPLWIDSFSARLQPGRIRGALQAVSRLFTGSAQLLRPQILLLGVAAGTIAWCAEGLGFQLICHGLGISLGTVEAIGVYALALLAGNAAIFMPGGIGGTEIVMTALLTARGAPLASALIATLLCRLATLWFAVVIGFVSTFILEFGPVRRRILTPP
jgi:uncharacterized membrane protein YbhN (UPF0104 family)